MVRCGRCANVFDGFKTLATLSDVTPLEVAPQIVARDDLPASAVTTSPAEKARVEPAVDARAELPPQEPAPVALPDDYATPESAPLALPDDTATLEPVPLAQTAVVESAPLPFAPAAVIKPAPRRRAGGWAFGALLLLVGYLISVLSYILSSTCNISLVR